MNEKLLSTRGCDLIKSFEELRLVAYRRFPGEPWTCGYGHTSGVKETTTCTESIADCWLIIDTHDAVMAVNRSLAVEVNQNQFDALVSFTYNVGTGAEAHSTLVALVNRGDLAGAGEEFLKWDHVDGKKVEGLDRRREAERDLFNTPEAT